MFSKEASWRRKQAGKRLLGKGTQFGVKSKSECLFSHLLSLWPWISFSATLHFLAEGKEEVMMMAATRNSRRAVEVASTSWSFFKQCVWHISIIVFYWWPISLSMFFKIVSTSGHQPLWEGSENVCLAVIKPQPVSSSATRSLCDPDSKNASYITPDC